MKEEIIIETKNEQEIIIEDNENQEEIVMENINIIKIDNNENNNVIIREEHEWQNSIMDFMGDSITYGYPNGDIVTKKYWEFLTERLNGVSYGYGIGGSTIADGQDSMYLRVLDMNDTANLIFVFGGTNDFGTHNIEIGQQFLTENNTRQLNLDTKTFYGALNQMCLNLMEKFPNATYVLLTPIHRGNFGNQKNELQANAKGNYLEDYVQAILNVGKCFSIPVIDLYKEAKLYPLDIIQRLKYFAGESDGLHPNTLGHRAIADFIYNKLKTIAKKVTGEIEIPLMSSIILSGSDKVAVNGSITIKANILPVNADISKLSWSVNNENVSISTNKNTCIVTGVKEGNVILTCQSTDGSEITITKNITVAEAPITAITINGEDSVYVNSSINLTASILPENANPTKVNWGSNNGNVRISPNGASCLVTGVNVGTSNITCYSKENNSIKDTKTITIKSEPPKLERPIELNYYTMSTQELQNKGVIIRNGGHYDLDGEWVSRSGYVSWTIPVTITDKFEQKSDKNYGYFRNYYDSDMNWIGSEVLDGGVSGGPSWTYTIPSQYKNVAYMVTCWETTAEKNTMWIKITNDSM